MPSKATKCSRSVCKKTSANPKRDGWIYIEFEPEPPKTGWWCPSCTEGLKAALARSGVEPLTDPLH